MSKIKRLRKGCLSCKKLKIKCNEAKPACEYCVHTSRTCVYPQVETPKETAVSRPSDFLFSIKLHLYNSMALQMNMTRFEYRLLRFFHDSCIPLFTFNVELRVEVLWKTWLPRYFASSDVIRQAVFAFACLNLWPHEDLAAALEYENNVDVISVPESDFSHVFRNLSVFENTHDNIFARTAEYFNRTVQQAGLVGSSAMHGSGSIDLIFFSSALIYAFLGLHPHRIVPVVDFEGDPPSDLLGFTASLRPIFYRDDGTPQSVHVLVLDIRSMMKDQKWVRSCLVTDLRLQLLEYFALSPFAAITSQTSMENEILSHFLLVLEASFSMAVKRRYPVPLFRVLFTVKQDFSVLVRQKHPFALRLLFVYCCICVYCHFSLLRNSNIWQDYIDNHVKTFGLCLYDQTLLNYVEVNLSVDFSQFSEEITRFDHEVSQMANMRLHLMDEMVITR